MMSGVMRSCRFVSWQGLHMFCRLHGCHQAGIHCLRPTCTPFPQVEDFFATRGISATTLERNRVAQERVAAEGGTIANAFPYYRC